MTTNLINKNIVKNHIAFTPLACALIPSIQFTALIQSIARITKNTTKIYWGICHTKSKNIISCQIPIHHTYTAIIAHHICANNLTICGVLNFSLPMYHNSSTNSTKNIGKTHKTNHQNILFDTTPGKNKTMAKTKLIYANTPIRVGTGHLTHFKSAPGLSKILNFLKTYRHTKNTITIKTAENK